MKPDLQNLLALEAKDARIKELEEALEDLLETVEDCGPCETPHGYSESLRKARNTLWKDLP